MWVVRTHQGARWWGRHIVADDTGRGPTAGVDNLGAGRSALGCRGISGVGAWAAVVAVVEGSYCREVVPVNRVEVKNLVCL